MPCIRDWHLHADTVCDGGTTASKTVKEAQNVEAADTMLLGGMQGTCFVTSPEYVRILALAVLI